MHEQGLLARAGSPFVLSTLVLLFTQSEASTITRANQIRGSNHFTVPTRSRWMRRLPRGNRFGRQGGGNKIARANLADMFGSLFQQSSEQVGSGMQLDTLPAPNLRAALGWPELSAKAQTLIDEDKALKEKVEAEEGLGAERSEMAQPRATLRLFDAPAGTEPEVTLYRDSASWCPYCEKVWLLLEEKRIPYRIEFVPMSCYGRKPESFLKIQPSGGIPVAMVQGRILPESNDILDEIERVYTEKPMIPLLDSEEGRAFQPMLRLERRLFSAWFGWLVAGFGESEFMSAADETEATLSKFEGPYFLGKELSLVDIMFAPFLERMAASLPYYKGLVFRGNPRWRNIERWFSAMEQRASFKGIQSDYYTHVHALPPQIGGCRFSGDYELYKNDIDGTAGQSWRVPLSDAGGVEPVRMADQNQKWARVTAAKGHRAVAKFATRALGESGRGVSAPFADPCSQAFMMGSSSGVSSPFSEQMRSSRWFRKSEPRMELHVDLALRTEMSNLPGKETAECLMYLRDRIGVSREEGWGGEDKMKEAQGA
eukprot:jgi/Bigna1/71920/fgenesh1_pg.17_\